MSAIDDLPIDPERDGATPVVPSEPRTPTAMIAGIALAVAALAVVLWLTFWRTPTAPAPAATAPTASTPSESTGPTPVAVPLPPMEQMDPFVRQLFSTLGSHPQLLAWLATDDLVGSMATAIDRLSQGQSPSRDLAPLRPGSAFAVVNRRGVTYIDAASYARYDPLVLAVTSVDAVKLAEAFTTLEPRLAEAYARQGHQGSVRDAVQRAAASLAATPDTPQDIQVVPGVGGYAYADPQLQALPVAQRHLLRMGPANVTRVRDAVRRFAAALANTR